MTDNEYLLPAHWASALINDDYSGYSDEDVNEIRQFLAETSGYPLCPEEFEPGFMPFNDAGTKACDCINFIFRVDNNEEKTPFKN
ncbi:hypothetical protein [Bacteroides sp. 51]|uniref:hypothetical protein n=1 Tax=Bacteroides sp. 51 TaxID=2302938 RepID=UPI0013D241C2|nr:hypothetical protein [Bacteroides sp. 51]NDV80783.1 hypothetical protein [Bacteroides sp. 51]